MTEQKKRTLGDVFAQILEDDKGKFDLEIPVSNLMMLDNGVLIPRDMLSATADPFTYDLTDWATTQALGKLEIPVRYFKNCPPELQAQNFNHWAGKSGANWLLRNRDLGEGKHLTRAVLSAERYSKLDNGHIVEILQQILGNGEKADYEVNMWHLDDSGFHLRIMFHDLRTQIGSLADGRPDIHNVGLHVMNSEIGKRSVIIAPMVYRLVCSNGLMRWVQDGDSFIQRHVHLKDHELYGRVAEAIGVSLKAGDKMVQQLIQAKETPIEDPLDIIRGLAEDKKYSQALTDSLTLSYASNQAQTGANIFSLVQAFTETAQHAQHPDARVELERDAADLLTKMVA